MTMVVLACFCNVRAQNAPNLNSIGGSANAVSTDKGVNIPVNYFTGMPNISIPIHSYSRNGISSTVSLNYYSGGIKAEELATPVGLGWRLKAGGVIIRSLRGLPDDHPSRGFMNTPLVDPGSLTGRGATRYSDDNYAKDSVDSQQDVFEFNVGNYSGSFVIGKDKKVMLIPEQNIKIRWKTGTISSATMSSITSFTMITEDGSTYTFDIPEITTRNKSTEYDKFLGYVSSWYLSSVTSPFAEDTIRFIYKNVSAGRALYMPTSKFDYTGEATTTYNSSDYVVVDNKYLLQIKFPYNVNLNFIYDSLQRVDVPGEYALTKIELKDSILRSGYKFEYGYFSNKGIQYPYNSTDTGISKMKLNKIYQYTQFQTLSSPYEFTYVGYIVPKVRTTAEDYWGFYNNKTTNSDLVPGLGSLTGANREVDTAYVKSGTLTAIKYPGGSKTAFDYEANDIKTYYYQDGKAVTIGPVATYPQSATFTITKYSSQTVSLTGHVTIDTAGCPVTITLKNAAGTVVDQFQPLSSFYRTLNLAAGTYTVSWAATGTCTASDVPIYTLNWLNEVQDTSFAYVGGIRIKKVTTQDSTNQSPSMVKEYRYKTESGSSSGFAIFKPRFDYIYTINYRTTRGSTVNSKKDYTVRVSTPLNNLDYVLGSPVGYSRVEEVTQNNGKTVYEYSTYKELNYYPVPPQFPYASKMYPAWEIGLPKKVSMYDQANKLLKITESKYNFYVKTTTDTAFLSIKLTGQSQSVSTSGAVSGYGYGEDPYYPVTGKTTLDSTAEKVLAGTDTLLVMTKYTYDSLYNTVSIKKWLSKDLQKYTFTNIYYPYNYTVTGALKLMKDSGIVVPVAVESWLKTPTTTSLQNASITGYELLTSVKAKPKYTYKLLSSQPVPLSTIGAFNGSVLNRNTTLMPLTSTVDKFDSKSVALEATDNLMGVKQSIIWDDEHQAALATVNNAAYGEMAYTSFEGATNGNWTVPAGTFNYSDAITGKLSYVLNGSITATVVSGKSYLVTYWTKGNAAGVNGTTGVKLLSYRGWNCYQHTLPNTTTTITVTGSNLLIDELRAYPLSATMNTITVEYFKGVTSTCNGNNYITYIEYDDIGRKILVKDVEKNIIEMHCFGDAGQKVNCNVTYKNNEIKRKFIQTNCTASQIPDTITYTVNPGTYTSAVSQYIADSLATNEAIQRGQVYANTNGSCNTTYIKMSYENVTSFYTEDIVVRFYADAACTIPKNVSNLLVTVHVEDPCQSGNSHDVQATVSGTTFIMIGGTTYYYEYTECDQPAGFPCYDYTCNVTFSLKTGLYVIK
ncbi:hypothetical protein GCM10022209_55210 [Chitinophaga oryziterrae]